MITIQIVGKEQYIYRLWEIGFSKANLECSKWNAPYFDDYIAYTYDEFKEKLTFYKNTENNQEIFVDDVLVGDVCRYWEYEKTRWLEIGIVIYDENYWNKGVGTTALKWWITDTFSHFPDIEHIGLTTWSGNHRMMKASEKLGLKQEACIRKVRYWQGVYYDSVKYGVLREEWEA